MAAFTPAEFKTRASPAFDSLTDAEVQPYLDMAECLVNETNWGPCKYPHGVFYLTGHLITFEEILKAANGATGSNINGGLNAVNTSEISSEKIKSWSVSYDTQGAAAGLSKDAFGATSWGKQYLTFRSLVFSNRCM